MFNIIILGLQGSVGVAAYGIIANISLIVIAIYTGIAQGVQPLISSCHGYGNFEGIKKLLRYSVTLLATLSTAIYMLVFIWNSQVVNVFNYEQNMLLQSIAETGIRVYFIGCIFAGFNIIISIFFTSTEKPRPAHVISGLRGFAIIIPMAFLLSELWGIMGVWSAFPATELIVTILGITLWAKRRSVII
jgi:Na+-driven multidrug efflux pump